MISKKKRLKYGSLVDVVFEALANSMIEGWENAPSGFRLPVVLGYLIKYILEVKNKKVGKDKIKRTIKELEKRNVLYLEKKDNKVLVYTEEKGQRRVIEHSIKLLLEFKKKNKKWNGKWFLVFFDVPEVQRTKRDYLRKFLKNLGFYPYQKSVYLFPYECEREVTLIKKVIEGAKYMKYIIAEKIEDEDTVKTYFNLS